MTVHHQDADVTVHHGDCLHVLRELPDASVDAVVTDPPYGLEFMGKDWDSFRTYAGGNPNMKPQGTNVGGDKGGDFAAATYGYRQKNPRCRRCGKLQRGNGACKCPEPQWDTRTAESANQFQFWCEEWAAECLRVLKPGGHLLAFGGTRTWHRLACAVEDAGFEVRDSIAWLYGSGFPKSLDIGKALDKAAGAEREVVVPYVRSGGGGYKGDWSGSRAITAPATDAAREWDGWGTALKPAFEPVVVARKPLAGNVAGNVLAHGVGGLNIDACRVEAAPGDYDHPGNDNRTSRKAIYGADERSGKQVEPNPGGRWPTNVALDPAAAAALDAQTGVTVSKRSSRGVSLTGSEVYGVGDLDFDTVRGHDDAGGASRFFPTFRYEAKAPTVERPRAGEVAHPTVKPLDLMRWLVRLVTPPGGLVLDPFAGSGTTAEAAILEGMRAVVVEREADYLPLIVQRITKPLQVGFDFDALT